MYNYLQQVKVNLDRIIASYNYQPYKFFIYAGLLFIILYFGSSIFCFFSRLPFLIAISLGVGYLLSR